jgi:hypothetical protein
MTPPGASILDDAPDDEIWEFVTGDVVRCRLKKIGTGHPEDFKDTLVAHLSGCGAADGKAAGLMPLDGTIGGLVGMLEVLRVECAMCGRQGRYHVARLIAELGPDYRLTDWLHERTIGCPQKNQQGVTRACGAVMRDLRNLP